MTANIRYFRTGEFLFREGEPSHCMYLIKKGTVSVRKVKGSTAIEIAKIYSNEVIGELSFFDRLPRSASAVALSEVEVMEIGFDGLDKIYAKVPDYLKTIIAAVAERLRRTNDLVRRLQKGSDEEEGSKPKISTTEPDAAAILAATADVLGTAGGAVPEGEAKTSDKADDKPGAPGTGKAKG